MNDTTKTTMQELLARWAELEPKLCRPCEDGIEVSFRHNEWCQVALDDIITLDLMWIQWSVQEAITERGWYFELSYSPERGYETEVGMGNGYSDKNLAEAILAAYLQALESE